MGWRSRDATESFMRHKRRQLPGESGRPVMQFAWIEPPSPKAVVSGQSYLVERARDNPAAFMTLLGKVLPTTLQGVNSDDLRVGYIVVPAKEPCGIKVSAHLVTNTEGGAKNDKRH